MRPCAERATLARPLELPAISVAALHGDAPFLQSGLGPAFEHVTSFVRVVIGDRNQLVREFLSRACRERGMQVVAEVSTVAESLVAASQHAPHVIVLSDPLAGSPVADAVKQIVHDEAKVVVFSDNPSPRQVICGPRAGSLQLSHVRLPTSGHCRCSPQRRRRGGRAPCLSCERRA